MKKIVLFNKSAAATAAAMPQNQKILEIAVGYIVRILCFNFQKDQTISTILMEKSAETAMVFYKSAPSAAAATPLNQKQ